MVLLRHITASSPADAVHYHSAVYRRHEIREYWQSGAADAQENVEFTSQVWAVKNDTAIAGWQASLTRRASGVRFELDGAFRLIFSNEHGTFRCAILEEWWHSKES